MTPGDSEGIDPDEPDDEQHRGEIEPRRGDLDPLYGEPPPGVPPELYWSWYYSGPLPLPRVVEGWESVLPGAADRIMSMAEHEQEHSHDMDRRGLRMFGRGQFFALILGLAAIFVGGYFGGGWGFAVIVSAVGGIIGAFLLQRRGPYPPPPNQPPSRPPLGEGEDETDESDAAAEDTGQPSGDLPESGGQPPRAA